MSELVSGFLKAKGKKIVNGEGKEIFLRGMGLGNWLLPEGYMWRFVNGIDRPRTIEAFVEDLIGVDEGKNFWKTFHERYITESDIIKMAEEGYNSIRLPINARVIMNEEDGSYIQENFLIIDRLISWCKKHKLYVFLDLHGAPGGQTGANIDDSAADHPDLFTERLYQERTIDLWVTLAERYKDEWIVAGYDLLNEPIPDYFNKYNDRLEPLYKEITEAIRKVDKVHMISVEGAHWATDFSIFTKPFDDNLVLHFHKYWSPPDTPSIQRFLDKREEWNAPLWMGEGGENNNAWFVGAFQLYEDHDISWCFWPWKKLDTLNTPCSINVPVGWDELVKYQEGGAKPSKEDSQRILNQYLDNILIENCEYHKDVVDAMMRRAPVKIPAEYFGFKGEGVSFKTNKHYETNVELRREEGVRLEFINSTDAALPNYDNAGGPGRPEDQLCVFLSAGEWLTYEINSHKAMKCNIKIRANNSGERATMSMSLDDNILNDSFVLDQDGWQEYNVAKGVTLAPGTHSLKVKAQEGTIMLHWIQVA